MPRAAPREAGHWRLPLSSPWSRQPEDQHCAPQHSLAKHVPPLQMCPSSWPRAICPAGHSTVLVVAVRRSSAALKRRPVMMIVVPPAGGGGGGGEREGGGSEGGVPGGGVPFTAAALESRKPASQHVPLLGAPQHSASLHPPVRHSYVAITSEH
jgi:hypothetical protein